MDCTFKSTPCRNVTTYAYMSFHPAVNSNPGHIDTPHSVPSHHRSGSTHPGHSSISAHLERFEVILQVCPNVFTDASAHIHTHTHTHIHTAIHQHTHTHTHTHTNTHTHELEPGTNKHIIVLMKTQQAENLKKVI